MKYQVRLNKKNERLYGQTFAKYSKYTLTMTIGSLFNGQDLILKLD